MQCPFLSRKYCINSSFSFIQRALYNNVLLFYFILRLIIWGHVEYSSFMLISIHYPLGGGMFLDKP